MEQVAARDVSGARTAMRDHLSQILDNYEQVMGDTEIRLAR